MAFDDLTGKRFCRWFVEGRAPNDIHRHSMWYCVCDCGTRRIVSGINLRSGDSKSCGCLNNERRYERVKHGGSGTRLYHIWKNIKSRCYNVNSPRYSEYGGRVILMCDEWKNDFSLFRDWAINNGYNDSLTIDRIDNNGCYSPDNCRCVNNTIQQNNKRNNHLITFNGKTQTMSQWSKELGIDAKIISHRLNEYHWDIERALSTPPDITLNYRLITYNGETKSLSEWARCLGFNMYTLWSRIVRKGWPIEKAFTTPVRKSGRDYGRTT